MRYLQKCGFRLAWARRKSVYKTGYNINNLLLLCSLKQLVGRLELVIFMWNVVVVLLVFRVVLWDNGLVRSDLT